MKLRGIFYFTIVLVAATTCFGVSQRQTYTDIAKDDSYLGDIYVAQIPDKIALFDCENMLESLPLTSIITKVKATDDVEHIGGTSRQLVKVEEIYKGENLEVNQEIYITSSRWSLSLYAQPYSIERGFVNMMEIGEEYLLFIDTQVDGMGEPIPVYQLYVENAIAPVFSYREHENIISSMGTESTYVLYKQVQENEFFGASQETVDAFLELKKKMLNLYE